MVEKYRLKEDFAGKKAGDILEVSKYNIAINWIYKGSIIQISLDNKELLEKVKEELPLFYTDEDEVYFDGVKTPVYVKQAYYVVNKSFSISFNKFGLDNNKYLIFNAKRFITKTSAEDYIKLQKAIKDSGLKIGDFVDGSIKRIKYFCSHWKTKPESFSVSRFDITGFYIYDNIPCAYNKSTPLNTLFLFPLDQFSKPKLLFGDKEVVLKKLGNSIDIICSGQTIGYHKLLDLKNAVYKINNFKFSDNYSILFGSSTMKVSKIDSFTIGCTTGTLEQLNLILKECDKLLFT